VKGRQSQRLEVRGAVGADGVGCGGGVSPPPPKKGSGEVAVPPPQKFLFIFILVQCVQKIFAFRPRGA